MYSIITTVMFILNHKVFEKKLKKIQNLFVKKTKNNYLPRSWHSVRLSVPVT